MKNKKKVMIILIIVVLLLFSFIYFSKFSGSTSCKNLLLEYKFDLKQSLPVGAKVNVSLLPENIRTLFENNKDTVVIFGSRFCGNCLKFDPSIPYFVKKYNKLHWVYIEKSDQEPISLLKTLPEERKNFSIVKTESGLLAKQFKSYYTPDIFFLHDGIIVYKKLGFMSSDFDSFDKALSLFQNEEYSKLTKISKRDLVLNKSFPSSQCATYSGKVVNIPYDFKGKPTAILILHGTCMRCKEIAQNIPKKFKEDNAFSKIVVFSPFSKILNEKSIEYAKKFGMKELYYELKDPPLNMFFGIDTVKQAIGNCKNIIYVNDELLNFQNSIGFVSAPSLIVLDKNGNFLGIYNIPSKPKDTIKFFNCLTGYIKNLK